MAEHRPPDNYGYESAHDARGSIAPSSKPAPWDDELDAAPRFLPSALLPSNLPRRRRFFGREEDLRAIDDALAVARPGTATLFGLAGIGKTALALEYAHRAASSMGAFVPPPPREANVSSPSRPSVRPYTGGVWWVSAEGPPGEVLARLLPSLRTAGAALRPLLATIDPAAPLAEIAYAVRIALQAQRAPVLLVLDGLDASGWASHLPGGDVRVLVTTRDDRVGLGARVRVGPLSATGARELAVALSGPPRGDIDAAALDRVLGVFAGLPAAVEAASSSVARWARSWTEYERYMYSEPRSLLDDRDLQGDYPDSALAALDRSIDGCPRGSWVRRLLEAAATLAPQDVPVPWATSTAEGDSTGLATKRALAQLRGLGLVTIDEDAHTLTLHPLIHRRIRERTEPDDLRDLERRAAGCVMAWLEETVDPTRTAEVEARRSHIEEALQAAERSQSDLVWLILADRFAAHLRHLAQYPEARSLLERAVIRAERLDPPNPPRVAESLSALASLLRDLGQPALARPHFERALAVDEGLFGARNPAVARDLQNLASTLKELGLSAEARPLLERALSIDEEANGPDHPNTAKTLSTLAAVMKDLGNTPEARRHLERALAIEERAFGPDHPSAVVRLMNLAMVLKDMGEAPEARPLLLRALAILETTYGPEHPIVATCLTNLALVLKDLGLAGDAMPLLRRAHQIAEKVLPANHPTRVKIAAHLAHTSPPPAPQPAPRRA